jgi:hypothetical protein
MIDPAFPGLGILRQPIVVASVSVPMSQPHCTLWIPAILSCASGPPFPFFLFPLPALNRLYHSIVCIRHPPPSPFPPSSFWGPSILGLQRSTVDTPVIGYVFSMKCVNTMLFYPGFVHPRKNRKIFKVSYFSPLMDEFLTLDQHISMRAHAGGR